jgi:hypothetical protein
MTPSLFMLLVRNIVSCAFSFVSPIFNCKICNNIICIVVIYYSKIRKHKLIYILLSSYDIFRKSKRYLSKFSVSYTRRCQNIQVFCFEHPIVRDDALNRQSSEAAQFWEQLKAQNCESLAIVRVKHISWSSALTNLIRNTVVIVCIDLINKRWRVEWKDFGAIAHFKRLQNSSAVSIWYWLSWSLNFVMSISFCTMSFVRFINSW